MLDTSPQIQAMQDKLFRDASHAKKFQLIDSLSSSMRELSLRAIRRANPDANELQIKYLFIELHYGRELADRVLAYIQRKL